jgi:hypothetical protein
MTITNKRLLISESRGDSNRCTPCRGKLDQHDTYASHASPRTPGVRFLWAVPVCDNLSYSHPQIWTDPLDPRRRAPDTIHSTPTVWFTGPYPASLLQQPKSSEESQAPVDNRLLGLLDPYHRHAIGMFNTYSRGPTERSLINTGRGYNLRGAGLPQTHSPTFPTSCPHFPLVAPPVLYFSQVLTNGPKCWV